MSIENGNSTGTERDVFYEKLRTTPSSIERPEFWPTADQLREARENLPDPREELLELNRQVHIAGISDVNDIKLRG